MFGGMVPVVQDQAPGNDLIGEQFRGGLRRRRIDAAGANDEIAKS